jgi:arylsulfatase A-like enzyme
MEAHSPYTPPKDYLKELDLSESPEELYKHLRSQKLQPDISDDQQKDLRALYNAEIRYLDELMKDLWTELSQQKEDFVLIIAGDHGENLGHNSGFWEHQYGIWERLVRVPLIVAGPAISEKECRKNVSLKEVFDIILGKPLNEVGQETVRAEYEGVDGFYRNFADRDTTDLQHSQNEILFNRSRMLLKEILD